MKSIRLIKRTQLNDIFFKKLTPLSRIWLTSCFIFCLMDDKSLYRQAWQNHRYRSNLFFQSIKGKHVFKRRQLWVITNFFVLKLFLVALLFNQLFNGRSIVIKRSCSISNSYFTHDVIIDFVTQTNERRETDGTLQITHSIVDLLSFFRCINLSF